MGGQFHLNAVQPKVLIEVEYVRRRCCGAAQVLLSTVGQTALATTTGRFAKCIVSIIHPGHISAL